MSYKFLLASVAISAAMLCTTQSSHAQASKRSFDKSAFSNFKSLPANKTACDKTVKRVHVQFDGWAVTTDKLNGYFTDIFGAPVSIKGITNPDKARNCMVDKLSTFGVNADEWKQVSNITGPKADYVNYKQTINAHEVVFASL